MVAPVAVAAVKVLGPRRLVKWTAMLLLLVIASMVAMLFLPVAFAIAVGSSVATAPERGGQSPIVSGDWTLPVVNYTITDDFGPRDAPCAYCSTMHRGTDMASGCNEPVYAASSGTINTVGEDGTYGFRIVIDHPDAVQTLYAHLAWGSARVSPGDTVQVGSVIALEGKTGQATGCHLHFETRVDGERVNSVSFMQARGITI